MSGHLTREEKNTWKDQVINSRIEELIKWLGEKEISFKKSIYGVELPWFAIGNTLKVNFPGSRRNYQYNLEGIKERIISEI